MVYSKTKQRFQQLQNQGTPLPGGGERYTADCCIYGCLTVPGYAWILQVCRVGGCSQVNSLNGVLRSEIARISAHATTSVAGPWETALRLGVANLVLSHRSAAKLSWKRGVLKGILNPSEYLEDFDSGYPLVSLRLIYFFEYAECVLLTYLYSQEIVMNGMLLSFLDM